MRGYGIPQAAFAAECMADDLALALHMDPLDSGKELHEAGIRGSPHSCEMQYIRPGRNVWKRARNSSAGMRNARNMKTRQDPCERESVWRSSAIRQAYIPFPWKQHPAA